jgi:WD40 repeat protein
MASSDNNGTELALRIFISSPGDVSEERVVAQRVVERIAARVAPRVTLAPILWEHEPLRASSTPQADVPDPAVCDMVVCILWSRLGTRLPSNVTRPDGSHYNSGTEFEFESAINAFSEIGRPHLLVYRKTAEATISLSDTQRVRQGLLQKENLDQFFKKWFSNDDGSLPRAFHNFQSIDEFEDRLEAHLTKLVMQEVDRLGVAVGESAIWRGNPFRGLSVFEAEHAPVFFGRRRQISDILDLMRRRDASGADAVCIIGPSGSGKSSCARAGVLPMMIEPGVMPRATSWRTAILTPGPRPLSALRAALASALALPADAPPPSGLAGWVEDVLKSGAAAPDEPHLVLLVDQLEEVFSPTARASDERDAFVAEVVALALSRQVWVIFTMRGDFTDELQRDPVLVELLGDQGLYHLGFPDIREFSELIRRPALSAGLRFETDPASGLSLDDLILKDAMAAQDALPLVQFCLFELFTRRDEAKRELTFAAYQALGGITGAIGERAEACFSAQPADVQDAFDEVFRGLAEMDDAANARPSKKHADKDSLTASVPAASLVEALLGARLLIAEDAPDGGASIRIAHEALFKAWPRLADWISENRVALAIRRRVEQGARLWLAADEDAQLLLAEGRPLKEAEDVAAQHKGLFAADAQRFIAASRERARKRTIRRRLAVGLLASLGVMVAAGSVAWGVRETAQSRRLAESSQRIEQSQALADERLRDLFTNEALRRSGQGDVQAAGVLLDAASATRSGERPFAEQFLLSQVRERLGVATGRLPPQSDPVQATGWIGTTADKFATGDVQGVVRLWNPQDSQLLASWEAHDAPVSAIASTPDGALIATSGMDGLTRVRRVAAPETDLALHYGHSGSVLGLALTGSSGSAALMATAGADNTFVTWKIGAEDPLSRVRLPGRPSSPVYAAIQEDVFAVGHRDGLTTLTPAGVTNKIDWPGETVVEIVAGPDLGWLAARSAGSKVRAWRRAPGGSGYETAWEETGAARLQPGATGDSVIVIRDDGSSILRRSGNEDAETIASSGELRILDGLVSRDQTCMLNLGIDGRLTSVHLPERGYWSGLSTPARVETRLLPAPGSDIAALTGVTGETQFLSLAECGRTMLLETQGDRTFAISAIARLAAFGREDGRLDLLNLDTGEIERTLVHAEEGWVNAVSFSLDGEYVATVGGDFAVWSAKTGELIHRGAPGQARNYQLGAFTAEGLVLIQSRPSAQSGPTIPEQTELRRPPRFDVPVGQREQSLRYALELEPLRGFSLLAVRTANFISAYWYHDMRSTGALSDNVPTAMAVAPSGGSVAVGDETGGIFVSLWVNDEDDPEAAWPASGSRVNHLQFSETGERLAASHADGRLRIFSLVDKSVVDKPLPAQFSGPMAFFEEGEGLVIGGADGVVRILSSETGALLDSSADLGGPILHLAFDAASRKLVAHSRDRRMVIDLAFDADLATESGEAARLVASNAPLRGEILEDDVVRLALEKLPGFNLTGEIGGGQAPSPGFQDEALLLAASDRPGEAALLLQGAPRAGTGSAKVVLAGLLAGREEHTLASRRTNSGRVQDVAATDKWVVASGWDGDIVALTGTSFKEHRRHTFTGMVSVVDILPEAPIAAYFRSAEGSDYVVGFWNFETGTVDEYPEFNSLELASDGRRVLLRRPTEEDGRRADVRGLSSDGVVGESIWTYEGPPAARFRASDNLEHLAVIDAKKGFLEIHPIDPDAGGVVKLSEAVRETFFLTDDPITEVAISDAAHTMLAVTGKGRVLRIDLLTGETTALVERGSRITTCIGASEGKFIVTTGASAIPVTAAGEIGASFNLEGGYVEACEAGIVSIIKPSGLLFANLETGETARRSASTSGNRLAFAGPGHVIHADRSGLVRQLDIAEPAMLSARWANDWPIYDAKLCEDGGIAIISGSAEVKAIDLKAKSVVLERQGLGRLLATGCLPDRSAAVVTADGVLALAKPNEAGLQATAGTSDSPADSADTDRLQGDTSLTDDTALEETEEDVGAYVDEAFEEELTVEPALLFQSAALFENGKQLLLIAATDADTLVCQSVGAGLAAVTEAEASSPVLAAGTSGPFPEPERFQAVSVPAALGDNLCARIVLPAEASKARPVDFQVASGGRPARVILAARNRLFALDLGSEPKFSLLGSGRGASVASRYIDLIGDRFLSYEAGGRAIFSRATDGSGALEEWPGHTDAISAAAALSDGRLVTADAARGLLLWDFASRETLGLESMRGASATSVAQLTPSVIVLGGKDGVLEFHDLDVRRAFARLPAHTDAVLGVVPLPDGSGFLSYSADDVLLHRLGVPPARHFSFLAILAFGALGLTTLAGIASALWFFRRRKLRTAKART